MLSRISNNRKQLRWISVGAFVLCYSFAHSARADARKFFNVHEATTEPKGDIEYEQRFNWKTGTEEDRDRREYEFRHELEIGLTDRLELGLYVSDWNYLVAKPADEKGHRKRVSEGTWQDAAVELIYNFSDPVNDPIGLSVYGEIRGGRDDFMELEGKVIAQKTFGSWTVAYNATLEAEWEEKHLVEDNGEIQQSAGISYQFSPHLSAGLELLHEIGIPDWKGAQGKAEFYLGPNVSYRGKGWYFTLTPLFQVSDIEDEPDFQLQLVVGIDLK